MTTKRVAVSGYFDPIHVGHLRMFKEASELAPRLIVVVNNDNFLMQKKGYVFMPITERMEIIKSFGMVDKVVESIDMDLSAAAVGDSLSLRLTTRVDLPAFIVGL